MPIEGVLGSVALSVGGSWHFERDFSRFSIANWMVVKRLRGDDANAVKVVFGDSRQDARQFLAITSIESGTRGEGFDVRGDFSTSTVTESRPTSPETFPTP